MSCDRGGKEVPETTVYEVYEISTCVHHNVVYVRRLLEYATCVWSPHRVGVGHINRVKSVQRKFTKRLPG